MSRARCLLISLSLIGVIVAAEAGAAELVPVAPDPVAVDRPASDHALAFRARWVTVPGWSLSPYLQEHTQLNTGWAVGLEYLYRHPGFDVVVSLDYTSLNADDGKYWAVNHDPIDEHFLHFDGLSVVSFDVSLIGHWNLTRWLEFRLGAGLGLGGVLGNLLETTNTPGCTADRVSSYDPANPGCFQQIQTYPLVVRVVPVLNTLIGFRFKAQKHVYIHLDAGWRLVGFYLGAGPEFRF